MMLTCKLCNKPMGVEVDYSVPATCTDCLNKITVKTPTLSLCCSKCSKMPKYEEGFLFRVVNQQGTPADLLWCLDCVRAEIVFHDSERMK